MNKDKRNNTQLLGTLVNADESGIIANANQVYDANEDKSTQDVSKEHKERIETLETKESSMQTTLENITKTGEASAASNVTYNHNDSHLGATNVQQAIDEVYSKGNTNRKNTKSELEKSISDNKAAVDASIQEVYKKSNYNDGDNIIDFNTIHLITDNPEYICVAVDANDKILYGIKTDGQPYFGVGCPQQVKDYIDEQINKILGTNDITTTIDSLKEIKSFLRDFTNSDTLKALLDTKANKTDVDNAIATINANIADKYKKSNPNDEDGNVVDTNTIFGITDNPQYVGVFTDLNGRFLGGFEKEDGNFVFVNKVPRDIQDAINAAVKQLQTADQTLQENIDAEIQDVYKKSNYNDGDNIIDFNTIHIITDNPEFAIAAVDANNKILYGIKADGQPYWGVGVPKVVRYYVDKQVNDILGTDNITETIDSLKEVEKFLSDFKNSDTLKALLDTKANKEDVDNTIANINADIADKYKKSNPNDEEGNVIDTNTISSIVDNPEYIQAITDSIGRLIEVIGLDGVRKFFAGINVQGTLQCVTDNPEYIAAWIDNQNRIVFGFKINGDPYFGYGIPSQINSVIESLKNNIETRIDALQQSIDDNILALDYNSDTGELYALTGETSTINASMDDNGNVYLEQEII